MNSLNKDTFDAISEKVVGHNHAKKVLINLVNRSKLRYYQKWGLLESENDELVSLSNCLLIGDSGTGKTFLVETLAEIMQFPLVKIDATELNPTGASGGLKKKDVIKKIEEKVKDLLIEEPHTYWSYEGTLDQVVVFVDEIDKLGDKLSSDWNAHVQANFLTLFENKGELSGITFIFAGAFASIEKGDSTKGQLGFHHHKAPTKKHGDLTQEIIKSGLIPELVGRMHHVVPLDQLKAEDYRKILLEQIIPKAKRQLEFFGISDFTLNEDTTETLIQDALDSGLGVRALQTGVNKLLVDIEFDPDSYQMLRLE